jgi:hypothetical protein
MLKPPNKKEAFATRFELDLEHYTHKKRNYTQVANPPSFVSLADKLPIATSSHLSYNIVPRFQHPHELSNSHNTDSKTKEYPTKSSFGREPTKFPSKFIFLCCEHCFKGIA